MNAQSSIISFTFENSSNIRSEIFNGVPYFVAKDICIALGYEKPRNAVQQHVYPDDALKQGLIDSLGRKQIATWINISGVYALIFGSKLPSAQKFKHWVTSEVLPALQNYGHYEIPSSMQQPKDELSDKDLTKIRDCIYRCANQFTYKNAFVSGAWYALRKATGVKSPDKFGYKHLDIIAKELQHMQHIADMYAKVKFKVEEELIKKCVRENGTTGELFEILSSMTVQLTNCDFDKIRQLKGSTSDLMLDM